MQVFQIPNPSKEAKLEDLLCFAEKSSDCNKYRNPSKVKQAPEIPEILEKFKTFEAEVTAKKKKEREAERQRLLKVSFITKLYSCNFFIKEQKRIMNQAIEREKIEAAKKKAEEEENKKKSDETLDEKSKTDKTEL